jgi:VanZ family protein
MDLARPSRYRTIFGWGAAAAWMALIFYLSSQSTLPRVVTRWEQVQDIVGHFLEYAMLALLLRWALASAGVRHPTRWAFVIAVAYALSDEFHQYFVPGRHADPYDLLTDAAGAAVALGLVAAVRALQAKRPGLKVPG